MEFAFTDEQQMIRDTADGFLAQISDSEAVRRAMTSEQGYDDAVWQRICTEMYWQAMHIPERNEEWTAHVLAAARVAAAEGQAFDALVVVGAGHLVNLAGEGVSMPSLFQQAGFRVRPVATS